MEHDQQQQEVFRGHVEECVQHLAQRFLAKFPLNAKGANKAKEPIAEFCGVNTHTVQRWFVGAVPIGEVLFRLMCYLNLMGYKVLEFENLPQSQRGFLELIAFNLITPEEAAQLLGYGKWSTLSQVFLGKSGTSSEKDNLMWETWRKRKEELAKKKEEARQRYHLDLSEKVTPPQKEIVRESTISKRDACISIMEGLLILLDEKELDEAGLIGNAQLVRRLWQHFNDFCSTLIEHQQKGGPDG